MGIRRLEHYNILTTDLPGTVAFYTQVLGMRHGPAPGATADIAAWIYDEADVPVVHLQAVDGSAPETKFAEIRARLGTLADGLSASGLQGSGAIEHVAFECDDHAGLTARLLQAGAAIRTNDIPSVGLRQIFVNDPNGVTIELNFR